MITQEEFSLALQELGISDIRPKIAVAVSGGGDSMALALLLQEWIKPRGGELLALTVDHKLRPESTAEAQSVQKILCAHGIAHEILTWEGEKPKTHLQEKAREARYQLLLDACRQHGFPMLAVAHNLEDQIETFWMRLAHGSGLDGLAAMMSKREVDCVSIVRPVLGFSREQLRGICKERDVAWVEDPSNENQKYLRVKLRGFEDLLRSEGLSPQRLSQTLQKLADARDALRWMTDRAMEACFLFYAESAVLNVEKWKEFPRDIRRRVLSDALMRVHPQAYAPGYEMLDRAVEDLMRPDFSGRTLAGCQLSPGAAATVVIEKEKPRHYGKQSVKIV